MNVVEKDIENLQNSLLLIRKTGGWSAEEFGDMIGVTKQTISNLENKKTTMTKTQYIAIRAVLDYEISDRPDDKALATVVNLCLNPNDLSETDLKTAQAFVEGATKTKLDTTTMLAGLTALIGMVAVEAIIPFAQTPQSVKAAWLTRILRRKIY